MLDGINLQRLAPVIKAVFPPEEAGELIEQLKFIESQSPLGFAVHRLGCSTCGNEEVIFHPAVMRLPIDCDICHAHKSCFIVGG